MRTPHLSSTATGRKARDAWFAVIGLLAMLAGSLALGGLLIGLGLDGVSRLDWQFLTSYPSRFADRAGILPAWVGSVLVMVVTACAAIPLGVAAAVYLEEYAPKRWLTDLIEINIAN